MKQGDRQRLRHILVYCDDIAGFIKRFGNDYDVFANDRAYINAVSMCILQIGELANGLSEEYRSETKEEMPWRMIRGMRNLLAHAYAEMDEHVLWETVVNDIPMLSEFCKRQLEHEKQIPAERPSVMAKLDSIKASQKSPQKDHSQKKHDIER